MTLPSLRERSDIERIIDKLHRKYRVSTQLMEASLLAKLLDYHWPGNLRELDNLMQVVCLMSEGEQELNLGHLPDNLQRTLAQDQASTGLVTEPLNNELQTLVNANIIASYAKFQGNVSQCAKHLGISRNTLYRKLKLLGLKK